MPGVDTTAMDMVMVMVMDTMAVDMDTGMVMVMDITSERDRLMLNLLPLLMLNPPL